MSQNNFAGGFVAGAFVGGIIGGIVGVLASSRLRQDETDDFAQMSEADRRRFEDASAEERMEIARRGVEDKISQLNMAIEDARIQMGKVNGTPLDTRLDARSTTRPLNNQTERETL